MKEHLGNFLADLKPGFASGDDVEDGVRQLRMHNITTDGQLVFDKVRRVLPTSRQRETQSLRVGDVVMNVTNSLELVGKSAHIAELDEETLFSNHFLRLRPAPGLDAKYLQRLLHAHFERGVFAHVAKKWIGQATVSQQSLLGLPVTLPGLEEQRRIAALLDQIDELRAKRRRTLTLLDELHDSELNRMLMRAQAGGQFELGRLASVFTGPFGTAVHKGDYEVGGVPLINPKHIRGGEIFPDPEVAVGASKAAELQAFSLRKGDVILGRRGEMGRAAEVRDNRELLCGTGSMVLRPHGLSPAILSALLRSASVRRRLESAAQGVTMLNLNQAAVMSLKLRVPSDADQKAYEERRASIKSGRIAAAVFLAKLDELFASLQHRAFTGQL